MDLNRFHNGNCRIYVRLDSHIIISTGPKNTAVTPKLLSSFLVPGSSFLAMNNFLYCVLTASCVPVLCVPRCAVCVCTCVCTCVFVCVCARVCVCGVRVALYVYVSVT